VKVERAPVRFGLSDHQLHLVLVALAQLDTEEQRALLLETIGDQVATRTVDLEDAISRALNLVRSEYAST
jgi:hypothetical protein